MDFGFQPLNFEWIAGESCLDFNNTVGWDKDGATEDRLRTARDLADWGEKAGLTSGVARHPAARVIEDARRLRKTLHRIFSPLSRWHAPAEDDLSEFNRYLARALSGARVVRGKGIFDWDFSGPAVDLDPVLAGVVWSAARLLASPELRQLRECANPECGWLFIDRSRRKNRRWCQMRECGNRAKARRYYERHSSPTGSGGVRSPA